MTSFLHIGAMLGIALLAHWLLGPPVVDFSHHSALSPIDMVATAHAEVKKPLTVNWQTLRELDYTTGKATPTVLNLLGTDTAVRVPGFMVPLDDSADAVTEFLLIPYAIACVHVPPPPPNQMIHVKMAGEKRQKVAWDPVWVQGRLQIVEMASPYGEAAYILTAVLVEPYTD